MDVKLVMFKSNGQRKDFPVINPKTVIGRAENCDLRIPLLSVSRRHCELLATEDEVQVRDLASSNGTYVNNERVNEAELNPGDRVVVGPVVFTLQVDGEPEDIKPVKTRAQQQESGDKQDVVDLEDDVVAQPGASALAESSIDLAGEQEQQGDSDVDPISALEALASDTDEEEDDENS